MRGLFGRRGRVEAEERGPEPSVSEALLSERPSDVLIRWADRGGERLREVLPDLYALRGVSQLPAHRDDAFIHTLKVIDAIDPLPVRRWAAMLHDIGKGPAFIDTPEGRSRFFEHDRIGAEMVPEIVEHAGGDPALVEPVQRLVRLHMRPISYGPDWTDTAVRRLVEEAEEGRGPEGWADLLALSRADIAGYRPEPIDRGIYVLDSLEARARRIREAEAEEALTVERAPRSPLDGTDLIALANREPGPWVGELKDYLLAEVLMGRLSRDDREGAARLALDWFSEHAEG